MSRNLIRSALVAAAVAVVAAAVAEPARAQSSPTPAGTVITNTATATYSDANGNAYGSVTATSSVTVAFTGALVVHGPVAAATVYSPSTDTTDFYIKNASNGNDDYRISGWGTSAAGLTVTGFIYNGTAYTTSTADTAALNVALAGAVGYNTARGDSLKVQVIYTIASGTSGNPLTVSLTAQSIRAKVDNNTTSTDTGASSLNILVAYGVNLNASGADSTLLDTLVNNATHPNYSYSVTVKNTGSRDTTYALSASFTSNPSGYFSIVSVNGTAGNSGSVTLTAGASQAVSVVYAVTDTSAAGSTGRLRLVGTNAADAAVNDSTILKVTIVRPTISMTKGAYATKGGASVITTAMPGDTIWYKLVVTNSGTSDAKTVSVVDTLPATVTYLDKDDGGVWTIGTAATTDSGGNSTTKVTATIAAITKSGGSQTFWIKTVVK